MLDVRYTVHDQKCLLTSILNLLLTIEYKPQILNISYGNYPSPKMTCSFSHHFMDIRVKIKRVVARSARLLSI